MGRFGIFSSVSRSHRVEGGKTPTALDHNLLAVDVDSAHDRIDGVRKDLSDHTLESHVSRCELDSVKRRVNELELDRMTRPSEGESMAKGALTGLLIVGGAVLLGRLISAAASSGSSDE